MTPDQEAEYALDFNVARSDLSAAAGEAYDRLLGRRRSGEPAQGASLADSQAAFRQPVQDAKEALADGRRVYICRVPMMYERVVDTEIGGCRARVR